MKKRIHLSKSLDEIKQYQSQINTYSKNNPKKNDLMIYDKISRNNQSLSSFNIIPEKNKIFFEKGKPKTNFLEEMYLKYSKNLQKYFIKNQTGLKLAGNKYFKNLTVEEYMKQNNLTQEEFIHLLNGIHPHLKNYYENEISKDNFFLTPMPNKSRQLLKTNKEKNDFLEAERSAVVMRTFEYTHGIKSKVGIYELKKIMIEQKQKLINIMLASASKIQRWWKKKYYFNNKNKNQENFEKKIMYYNYMLNKKKAKIFTEKIKNLYKKKKKPNIKLLIMKLKLKAKNSMKKYFSIYEWIKNMKICSQIKFNIFEKKYPLIKKNCDFKNNFFISKKSFKTKNNTSQNGINTEIYQIKKIIFIQKMFRYYIQIKKGKQNLKKYSNINNSQFTYYSPNKMIFLYNKSINLEAKESKKKSNNNNNQNNKKKEYLPNLSPISKNINENDYYLENNDNINNEPYNKINKDNNKEKGQFNIEVRSDIYNKLNKKSNIINNIPVKKIFKNKQNIKKINEIELKNKKNKNKLNKEQNKKKKIENDININKDSENNYINKGNYNSYNYKQKKIIPQKITLKNNLLKIEENELSLITTTNNNNINDNISQNNNNNLILIDSLEMEKEKNKKIINNINSNNEENEYFENSIPPELNIDNYQQDSIIDFKDKRFKSNQKTISTSAILRLDTSDNHIFINNNQYFLESTYPFQILGQIYLNYIHRPLINNNFIEKINKKYFSSDIKIILNKAINIRNNFSLNKQILINPKYILKIYLKKWKNIINKTSLPYNYSKIITSINTTESIDKNNFTYYCKINKSNQENDFIFLRISLGYKLLKKIFCINDIKKFIYLLKRRRRRNINIKKYNLNSTNNFHLLEFKIKLPVILNKIIIRNYYGLFFHKFLYVSINFDKYNLNNNKCKLIIEGFRKGYFRIIYNILQNKFNYEYFNTGLKLSTFFEELLSLK